jgi:hypothetical protein
MLQRRGEPDVVSFQARSELLEKSAARKDPHFANLQDRSDRMHRIL